MNNRWLAILVVAALPGCTDTSHLRNSQDIDRPDLSLQPVPVGAGSGNRPVESSSSIEVPLVPNQTGLINPRPINSTIATMGTFGFTAPRGVTQVKRTAADSLQFILYHGVPAGVNVDRTPTNPVQILQSKDKPFLVISVEPDPLQQAGSGIFARVQQHRTYLLNGLPTEEWTGFTRTGLPFSELIVSHGRGDRLHAIAIGRDAASRQDALATLSSITWKERK